METMPFEKLCPVCRPLLVDVAGAALAGNCGGEHDYVSVADERLNEGRGRSDRDVFRHFERHDEIEPPAEVERLLDIPRLESLGRNQQCGPVDVVPIYANHVCHSPSLPSGEPCP